MPPTQALACNPVLPVEAATPCCLCCVLEAAAPCNRGRSPLPPRRGPHVPPGARLVEVGVDDARRLCKWLGSSEANAAFNRVMRYALTESARFCPSEDHRGEVKPPPPPPRGLVLRNPATPRTQPCNPTHTTLQPHARNPATPRTQPCNPTHPSLPPHAPEPATRRVKVANVKDWNWRNPFTAYNCTWGFHHPTDFPEPPPGAAAPCALHSGAGMTVVERDNSTTCARAMLCDWNTHLDGSAGGRQSRCNLEGYGGVDTDTFGNRTREALAAMPGGRCPIPPGDVPGGGLGFDRVGRWVGEQQGAEEMARLRLLERAR